MFRCSPRPGTRGLSQARQLYFVFCRLFSIAFMPFKNIGTNLSINACGSRCIAVAAHQSGSFAGQAQAKSAASSIRYWDVAKSALYLPLPRFSTRRNTPRVMSSPASNAACSMPRISASPAHFVGVLGFGRVLPVSGCPSAHDPLPLAKSVQSFHGFDVFSVWGACLRA